MGGSAWRGRASFHPRQRRAPKAPYRRLNEGPGQMGPGNKCRDDSLWAAGMSRSWRKSAVREALCAAAPWGVGPPLAGASSRRSEEHTSEHQSLMRTAYAVFTFKKKHTYDRP